MIFVEHDWNPMKDLQAMDRAHRIGQKKVGYENTGCGVSSLGNQNLMNSKKVKDYLIFLKDGKIVLFLHSIFFELDLYV